MEILTDHKNLQYFKTKRTLTEGQIRWKGLLDSLPSFKLRYRPGKEASRSDALSRLEQDAPKDINDARLKERNIQLINKNWIAVTNIVTDPPIDQSSKNNTPFDDEELVNLWYKGLDSDGELRDIKSALESELRCFPPSVTSKISISECAIDECGFVRWRGRLLIPNYEPFQTALIHKAHDSPNTGHPGRDGTLSILRRDFF